MTVPLRREHALFARGVGLWIFCCALFRLGQVALLLRSRSYQWVVRRAEAPQRARKDAVTGRDFRRARRYARQIERASYCYPARVRCLHRSLVLHHWLRREGLSSILRIGVSKGRATLMAHAWVELDGQVVNDSAAAVRAFTPLADTAHHIAPAGGRATWMT
jgi:hypothetical protein